MSHNETLYNEIEYQLMNDPLPSIFLSSTSEKPDFKKYPFDMLFKLKATEQSPQYHPEGNVWNHTLLVVDIAAKEKSRSKNASVFMWAALLHDIGKPSTTKERKGKITAYDHDIVGAELSRKFLSEFTDDNEFMDKVYSLIRYHMQILYVIKGLDFADIKGMKEHADIQEVALLGLCDRLGRLDFDRASEESNIRMFIEKCSIS